MSQPPLDTRFVHYRLQTDLEFFNEHAPLLIKDKTGNLIKFRLNIAQRYIHSRLEEQLKQRGWVRALLLKGRQQGGSTYINARFYHKASRNKGKSVFILSHEGKTTDKLFDMVRRFQDNVNPALRPVEGKSNTRQLAFAELLSDYVAATAGNEHAGRGGTAQLLHGSEAAYWEHAYAIQDGALESIGLVPGTEIILESTANGAKGLFYEKCMTALKGIGDYILIFVPWYWQDEYEREYSGEDITDEEAAYALAYFSKPFPFSTEPISRVKALRKLMWRRAKIVDLSTGQNLESGLAKFRNIYPANPIEAFQSSGVSLVRPEMIVAARKATLTDEEAPFIGGVDPAGDSDSADRTVIALRRGRHLERVIKFTRMRPMELAGILAKLIDKEGVDMLFIDRGYGEGTLDRLREMGYGRRVQGVAFNERPLSPDIYLNKRSEMLIECANWINAGDVRIPDDDDVHADFACVPLDEQTSNGLKFLKPKREIKKILGRSHDIFDAVGLTFAYPVRRAGGLNGLFRKADAAQGSSPSARGPLKSLARARARRSS